MGAEILTRGIFARHLSICVAEGPGCRCWCILARVREPTDRGATTTLVLINRRSVMLEGVDLLLPCLPWGLCLAAFDASEREGVPYFWKVGRWVGKRCASDPRRLIGPMLGAS